MMGHAHSDAGHFIAHFAQMGNEQIVRPTRREFAVSAT